MSLLHVLGSINGAEAQASNAFGTTVIVSYHENADGAGFFVWHEDKPELSLDDLHAVFDYSRLGDILWSRYNLNVDADTRASGDYDEDYWTRSVYSQEQKGRLVRQVWIAWAKRQPSPKPSWLVEWEGLSGPDQEVDMLIGEALTAAALRPYLDLCNWIQNHPRASEDERRQREAVAQAQLPPNVVVEYVWYKNTYALFLRKDRRI